MPRTLKRRLVTITAVLVAFAAWTLLLPLTLLGCAVADAIRGGRSTLVRCAIQLEVHLLADLLGLLAVLLTVPLRGLGEERFVEINHRLQAWFIGFIVGGLRLVFGLRIEVEGEDLVRPGPILVLLRHASMVDTALPVLVLARHGIRSRYVLKTDMLWEPCVDLVGNRLPNAFVTRRAARRGEDLDAIASIGRGLGPRDAAVIYPEGTRFEARVRDRIAARFEERGEAERAAWARSLRQVLPPRPAGVLTLLSASGDQQPDVLIWAHTGFEPAMKIADLVNGGLRNTVVRLKIWRVPAGEVPEGEHDRITWLNRWWERVDGWIVENRAH